MSTFAPLEPQRLGDWGLNWTYDKSQSGASSQDKEGTSKCFI